MKIAVPEGYILMTIVEYEQQNKEIDRLGETVRLLMARVNELEGMIHKDSHNSHKPPSSDWYNKKIKNSREKNGKKVGGQPGHEGNTLRIVEKPYKIIKHTVEECEHCGFNLRQIKAGKNYRRQVHDIPPIKIEVTEYQIEAKCCPVCKHETVAGCEVSASVHYGERLKSAAVYLNQYQMLPVEQTRAVLEDLFGSSPSAQVMEQSSQQCYKNLESVVENHIKSSIISSRVMHNDETGMRCEGKTKWIHSYSTHEHTYYVIDDKRGKEAMERIDTLPKYKGISVHDRWASYDEYDCAHALCNAHLLRDLKLVEEEYHKQWAATMRTLLCDANKLNQSAMIAPKAIKAIEKRYDTIVKKGLRQEPVSHKITGQRGRKAKSKSMNLLVCFRDRKKQILLFLHNKDVPFDNNLAERDLRMVKLKQKISGCFRTQNGAEIFCRIRSYISTVRKQGGQVWDALQNTINSPQLIAV